MSKSISQIQYRNQLEQKKWEKREKKSVQKKEEWTNK